MDDRGLRSELGQQLSRPLARGRKGSREYPQRACCRKHERLCMVVCTPPVQLPVGQRQDIQERLRYGAVLEVGTPRRRSC